MQGKKRRFRKSTNRVIAGVCAGFAEWVGWQPIAGRVFFVLMSIMSFIVPAVLVYLLLALLLPGPEDRAGTASAR